MQFGIDVLLHDSKLRNKLTGRRLALLGHPASLTATGQHSMDALIDAGLPLRAAFGPQHGMRGDKQDNMVESETYVDPVHQIPVYSLYGEVRRPTPEMMAAFDVLLVDLQDIGTRIYTYVSTLTYLLEACAAFGKTLIVLDRPNPAGRPIEGTILEPGFESFVGTAPLIMRHGLTMAEIARWYVAEKRLDIDLEVVAMQGYEITAAPGYGWPVFQRPWINPSPNAASVNMARCFPGTVLFEGTTLSEGRGTTVPLELIGAPDIDARKVLQQMHQLQPGWLEGALIRPCFFEPTFHKHQGRLCSGLQIHTDYTGYDPARFKPYRLAALILKAIRQLYPDYPIWRHFVYEYEHERLAIDLLTGGQFLRDWVDDPTAQPSDLAERLNRDEQAWQEIRAAHLIYPPADV